MKSGCNNFTGNVGLTRGHTMVTPRVEPTFPVTSLPELPTDTIRDVTEGEQTVVRARPAVLYQVEVWRNSLRESVVPITKAEITIGRGSRTVSVDLPIKGDAEVSRVHATLSLDSDGRYWLVAKGRNPTLVNGHELPRGERAEVAPDQKIAICGFVLRIQPK